MHPALGHTLKAANKRAQFLHRSIRDGAHCHTALPHWVGYGHSLGDVTLVLPGSAYNVTDIVGLDSAKGVGI